MVSLDAGLFVVLGVDVAVSFCLDNCGKVGANALLSQPQYISTFFDGLYRWYLEYCVSRSE